MYKKKICSIMVCLIIILLFTSCYHFESEHVNEYDEFYQNMQEKNDYIYGFLPLLEDNECIDDMYLFYSDRDLLDSYYTIYLNCKYSEKEYRNEEKRITELFVDEDLLVKNSDSFDYESLMYSNLFVRDSSGIGIMDYQYVLFSESDFRIVYITFFDKELNGKSINIPEKYLPKELVDLRNT